MSVETAFRALLAASGAVTALVAGRIAQDAVPNDLSGSLIVFACRHDPTYALDGTVVCDPCSLTVQCWALDPIAASDVADAVTTALATAPARAAAQVVDRSTTFDPEIGKDGVVLTVQWWG
jgi:hypothetical protein